MFTLTDYLVLVAYVAAVALLGSWLGRGQTSLGDYFLAGKKMPWFVVCVSIIATDLSAIGYMGVPSWIYERDLKYHASAVLHPLIMLFVLVVFIRVFYRLKVFTVYQYLEHRFHPLARSVTAFLFLLQRGVWLATAIYAPSLALSTVSGIPVLACILGIGLIATLYTVLGGMKAVIWTDFLQFIVLLGGLYFMIGVALAGMGWDVAGVWARASELIAPLTQTPHTTFVDFTFDFNTEATVWSLFFFLFIYNVGTYGTDQVVAQRYFTMASFREVSKSVITSGFLGLFMTWSLAFLGLTLVVFYDAHPESATGITEGNRLIPHFVATQLPPGFRGLVIAALFAATMSSVDSGLNSISATATVDLYKPHFRRGMQASEAESLRIARVFTLIGGGLATLVAIWISTRETNIVQTVVELASKFIGPITGIFFLGVLTRRGNLQGVIGAAVAGLACSFLIGWGPIKENVNWLWTAPLSSVSALLVGYLASVIFRPARKSHKGLRP